MMLMVLFTPNFARQPTNNSRFLLKCWLRKEAELLAVSLDIKSAFRLLPIHLSDFNLLGFRVLEKIYIDIVSLKSFLCF